MKKVLFVCIHNTARSVMAEAIFNSLAKSWKAESAGIERAENIDETVKRLLAERGLSVKERPRLMNDVDINSFDLIIAVCEESRCIVIPSKDVERWNIENPAGKDEEVYRKVFADIESRVAELVKKLEAES